jgi:hypothetical protein
MESRIFRREQGLAGELGEFPFAVGAAGVDELGNMRLLVGSAFLQRRGADIEVVEAFVGGGEEHRDRKAGRRIEWKDEASMI